ncbi:MAG TPA: EamA family transporter [Opitutaceae bacterium]|nr:EamA family transporter [Opitutaceae bacterium]
MTLLALVLVLVAAALHATWNYWAKRAGGGLPFVYLVGIIICTGYVPVVAVYCHFHYTPWSWSIAGAIVVSGVLKTSYSLFLQRGYRTGDFSLIYPLARGTGPLLSATGAMLLFRERPSAVAITGGVAIVVAIFWVAGGHRWLSQLRSPRLLADKARLHSRQAVFYGITTGIFIAAYTLWDKRAVSHLLIAPLLYDAGTAYTQLVLLSPLAWRRRAEVAREWREHRLNAFIMAATAPVGYILILTAMKFTAVSYVAPAREVSILIGLFFGARFLNEREARNRFWAALVMFGGLIALAVG